MKCSDFYRCQAMWNKAVACKEFLPLKGAHTLLETDYQLQPLMRNLDSTFMNQACFADLSRNAIGEINQDYSYYRCIMTEK